MKTKHTPGPWTIQPDPKFKHLHPYHDFRHITNGAEFDSFSERYGWGFNRDDGVIICDLRDSPNQKANARLIASAPELLEALREIIRCNYRVTMELDLDAREAIRKATGE